jgi:hypothetical protein
VSITAGHLAVLAERSEAGPLQVTLFDGIIPSGRSHRHRPRARHRSGMAG